MIKKNKKLRYISHRGLNFGLANSLKAISKCWESGLYGVEIDIRVRMGRLYLSHDLLSKPKDYFDFSMLDRFRGLNFFIHLKQPFADYQIDWPEKENFFYFKDDLNYKENRKIIPKILPFGYPDNFKYQGLIWADTNVLTLEKAEELKLKNRVIWIDETIINKKYYEFSDHISFFALCTHL